MKTVRQLQDILGLNTIHQTRNRVNAIKELISDYVRRGDNNQLLISDRGVDMLTRLQDLYESGLLLSEAADVVRSEYSSNKVKDISTEQSGTGQDPVKRERDLVNERLMSEIKFLRNQLRKEEDRVDELKISVEESELKTAWWNKWLENMWD